MRSNPVEGPPKPSQNFLDEVKSLERGLFPEFRHTKSQDEGYDIIDDPGKHYFYFAPSWHIQHGLVTEEDIRRFTLDRSKKLLSIGSGAAYLERTLVELGLDLEQVTLADVDLSRLPKGFQSVRIDVHQELPDLQGQKFDLVIIPEALLLNNWSETEMRQRGVDINDNRIRLRLREEQLKSIVERMLKIMNPGGELRINGHSQGQKTIEDALRDISGITYSYSHNLISVRKTGE